MRIPLLRAIYLTALCIFCILLSSCLDGQEEITVREDGSGSAQLSYNIPLRALTKEDCATLETYLKGIEKRHPDLKLTHFSTKPSGFGMQQLEINVEFKSVQKVAEIYQEEICNPSNTDVDPETQALLNKACALVGSFDASFNGYAVMIHREVNLQPLFDGKIKNPKALGESEFRYILHLPQPVGPNNATHVSDDGKTLQWTAKLRDHVDSPIVMQSSVLLPWWVYLIAIIVLLLVVALPLWLLIRLRKKKADRTALS